MRKSRILTIAGGTAAAGALAATAIAGTAGAAAAQTATLAAYHPAKAFGSVELGNPEQYETFLALQQGYNHGAVNYTNFTYADTASNVWAPVLNNGSEALTFTLGGQPYGHHLDSSSLQLKALSNGKVAFSGTGSYDGGGITWKMTGTIAGTKVKADIAYDGQAYKVHLEGQIAKADGSVSGTATSSTGQVMSFTWAAGSVQRVLHYAAPVRDVKVGRHDASFAFTIPAKVPGLAGVKVTVKVHDGGWGAKHDTYSHGVTGGAQTAYPIEAGNIAVQK